MRGQARLVSFMGMIRCGVTRDNVRRHEMGRAMLNSDPECHIFLSTTHTHDRYFFLYIFSLTAFFLVNQELLK